MREWFDQIPDRRRIGAVKWDVKENELPMWVADMDFAAAPAIRAALENRVAHGVFGYSDLPAAWNDAYVAWWRRRHGLEMDPDALIFTTGVIPAISTAVRKLTTPAEKAVVLTPVYNIFFNSIVNNGRVPVEVPLLYANGRYEIDFPALEAALADPQVSLLIFCNPHNPVGRIWTRAELAAVGELCKKHGVTVISDEIHCDITLPGTGYVPFAAAGETCAAISVTCLSPGKCFNLAGLGSAAVYVPDPFLRHKMWRALNTDEVAEPNAFAVEATLAAFNESEDWVNEMNAYVAESRRFAEDYIREKIPALVPVHGEATYLMWIDCAAVTDDAADFCRRLREETGLFLNAGNVYGKTGETFVRLNLATSRKNVEDGMDRLRRFVNA